MRWLVLAMLTLLSCPASAHAMLEQANPAAGAVLPQAPRQVVLEFSESLEPAFSSIAVVDDSARDMTLSPATASGATMAVRLKPLRAGVYRVEWQALSVDTHHTEGSFRFSVKP